MGVPKPGTESSYTIGTLDSNHESVDGAKTCKLVGSQDKGIKANPDGSYDVYFGPTAPER